MLSIVAGQQLSFEEISKERVKLIHGILQVMAMRKVVVKMQF